jgi:cytochrome P450
VTSTDSRTGELAGLVRLDDPDFYLDDPFPVYARLQNEAPLFRYEPRSVWVVSRYEDVRAVLRDGQGFVSSRGTFLHDADKSFAVAGEMFGDGGEQLSVTDPPRHTELRGIVAPTFNHRHLARLTGQVTAVCDALLDRIEPGSPVDVVETVMQLLPIHTACALLGLPGDNVEDILRWSDELERMASTELADEEFGETSTGFYEAVTDYLREQFDRKRADPGQDLLSTLLRAEAGDTRLSPANSMMFAILSIAAGNDTTRALLSWIVALLAEHPEQRAALDADPALVPAAVEEVLRFATPGGRGFLRTATRDSTVAGHPVHRDEQVYLLYDAANRDPSVYPDPATFDVRRSGPSPHLAFGFGAHGCLGAPLARLEARVLLERLLARFPSWELAGPGERVRTVLRSGWVSLPAVFHR